MVNPQRRLQQQSRELLQDNRKEDLRLQQESLTTGISVARIKQRREIQQKRSRASNSKEVKEIESLQTRQQTAIRSLDSREKQLREAIRNAQARLQREVDKPRGGGDRKTIRDLNDFINIREAQLRRIPEVKQALRTSLSNLKTLKDSAFNALVNDNRNIAKQSLQQAKQSLIDSGRVKEFLSSVSSQTGKALQAVRIFSSSQERRRELVSGVEQRFDKPIQQLSVEEAKLLTPSQRKALGIQIETQTITRPTIDFNFALTNVGREDLGGEPFNFAKQITFQERIRKQSVSPLVPLPFFSVPGQQVTEFKAVVREPSKVTLFKQELVFGKLFDTNLPTFRQVISAPEEETTKEALFSLPVRAVEATADFVGTGARRGLEVLGVRNPKTVEAFEFPGSPPLTNQTGRQTLQAGFREGEIDILGAVEFGGKAGVDLGAFGLAQTNPATKVIFGSSLAFEGAKKFKQPDITKTEKIFAGVEIGLGATLVSSAVTKSLFKTRTVFQQADETINRNKVFLEEFKIAGTDDTINLGKVGAVSLRPARFEQRASIFEEFVLRKPGQTVKIADRSIVRAKGVPGDPLLITKEGELVGGSIQVFKEGGRVTKLSDVSAIAKDFDIAKSSKLLTNVEKKISKKTFGEVIVSPEGTKFFRGSTEGTQILRIFKGSAKGVSPGKTTTKQISLSAVKKLPGKPFVDRGVKAFVESENQFFKVITGSSKATPQLRATKVKVSKSLVEFKPLKAKKDDFFIVLEPSKIKKVKQLSKQATKLKQSTDIAKPVATLSKVGKKIKIETAKSFPQRKIPKVKQINKVDKSLNKLTKTGFGTQKFKDVTKQTDRVSQRDRSISRTLTGVKDIQRGRNRFNVSLALGVDELFDSRERARERDRERIASAFRLNLSEKQITKQSLKIDDPTFPFADFPFPDITGDTTGKVPPGKPPAVPFKFPLIKFPESSKQKRERSIPYDVFIRKKKIADNLPKQQALDTGAYVVDNTTSAQFRIVRSSGKVQKPKIKAPANYFFFNKNKFRNFMIKKGKQKPLKNKYIEKRNRRLDTAGETRQLTASRFLKAQGNLNKRTANFGKVLKGII